MKRVLLLVVLLLMLFPVTANAHDLFIPEWRGFDGTTYQEWTFDTPSLIAEPETIINDYGTASAAITVGVMGSGYLADPMLGTQTGVWDIGGDDGRIVIDIDNTLLALEYKEISLQITYYKAIGGLPSIDIPTAQFVSSQDVLIEEDMIPGMGWYLYQSTWRIYPNPDHEQIILTGDINGSVIDQIVVDTYCVPEPASIVLLMIGGFTVFRKRNRRA